MKPVTDASYPDYMRWLPPETESMVEPASMWAVGSFYEDRRRKLLLCFGACTTNRMTLDTSVGDVVGSQRYVGRLDSDIHTVAWLHVSGGGSLSAAETALRMLSVWDPPPAHAVKFGKRECTRRLDLSPVPNLSLEHLRTFACRLAEWNRRTASRLVGHLLVPRGDVDPLYLSTYARIAYVRFRGEPKPAVAGFDRLLDGVTQ